MKRNTARATLVIVFVAAIWAATAVPAAAQRLRGVGTVMTYNVNEGTDFQQVVGAQTLTQFLLAGVYCESSSRSPSSAAKSFPAQ